MFHRCRRVDGYRRQVSKINLVLVYPPNQQKWLEAKLEGTLVSTLVFSRNQCTTENVTLQVVLNSLRLSYT